MRLAPPRASVAALDMAGRQGGVSLGFLRRIPDSKHEARLRMLVTTACLETHTVSLRIPKGDSIPENSLGGMCAAARHMGGRRRQRGVVSGCSG